jgi:hypothetical protein
MNTTWYSPGIGSHHRCASVCSWASWLRRCPVPEDRVREQQPGSAIRHSFCLAPWYQSSHAHKCRFALVSS